ncbi:MAG: NAD-binding protein [Candidatus Marsarchaeota archaeon]|jgi:voltage-gated potassium channel Kch|nr:NAD-binding protein [Candidatus Marsarchaeota archaeon]MCL5419075.1 NAD-binding protein [Candidatus Marsarchaeota archaeon]
MASSRRSRYELLGIAALLFLLSIILTLLAGVRLQTALIENIFGSLEIGYAIVSFNVAENIFVLASAFFDTIVFALITVVFASAFFSAITKINIRERRMLIRIKKLQHHSIVVPFNGFAMETATELKGRGKQVVVVCRSKHDFEHVYRKGMIPIIGDERSVELFKAANIDSADNVIVCDENDISNTLITMTAKTANSRIKIVSRVSSEGSIPKLGMAGAHRMIMPEITAGEEVGNKLVKMAFE